MKIQAYCVPITALVFASLLAACGSEPAPAPAPAADAPAATEAPAAPAPESAPAATAPEAPAAPTTIPDTADGIWQAIDKHKAELQASIRGGSLAEVHHHAFAIRDLVAALPTHTPSLPDEEKAKLTGEVGFVATLADRLDSAGDGGDQAQAQSEFDKLSAVLNGMTRYK